MDSKQDSAQFSIIIPTYNRGPLIRNTIDSALNQNFENFEVIVVDDGSTDNTETIVKSIKDTRLVYYKKENAERGAARNFGAQRASGKYINFLDSDDLLYSNHLSAAYDAIVKIGYPEIFYFNYDIKDNNGNIIRKGKKNNGSINDQLLYGNLLSCNGVFIQKKIIMLFQFNEDRHLSGTEDWELWLRLASRYKFHYSNEITSSIVHHNDRSVLNTDEEKLLLRKKLTLHYAFEDKEVRNKFQKYYRKMESYFDTYISLHLVLEKKNGKALLFLKNAIIKNPSIIFTKRTFAIIKRLLL